MKSGLCLIYYNPGLQWDRSFHLSPFPTATKNLTNIQTETGSSFQRSKNHASYLNFFAALNAITVNKTHRLLILSLFGFSSLALRSENRVGHQTPSDLGAWSQNMPQWPHIIQCLLTSLHSIKVRFKTRMLWRDGASQNTRGHYL